MCTIPVLIEWKQSTSLKMAHRKPLYAVGEALLKQLQTEAMLAPIDDDRPSIPDPFDSLASAQSRRTMPVQVSA